MTSPAVTVAVRIRPLSGEEKGSGIFSCCHALSDQVVAIKKEATNGGYLKSQMGGLSEYAFDAVFDESSSQREVYERTAQPYLKNLVEGLNVTVFAYGATGAGKTHTMMGNARSDDEVAGRAEAGIIPNAMIDLFKLVQEKRETAEHGEEYSISVSFIEVYNEQVYDLLENTGKALSLREDQERGVVVIAGVAERTADSPDSVLDFLSEGNLNRKTEATMANSVSSRSHAVLQISLKHSRKSEGGRPTMTESKLSLIDLAGSERASATNNRGARLQEGANINKSLLALANCINALAAGDRPNGKKHNVKYRDSKLTHLLKSSLEGNCNLIIIANINPSHLTYEDSHNTLKYSNRAKNIKINPIALEQKQESNWMEREATLKSENNFLRNKVQQLELEVKMLREEREQRAACPSCSSAHTSSSFSNSLTSSIQASPATKKDEEETTAAPHLDESRQQEERIGRDSLDGLSRGLSGMDVIGTQGHGTDVTDVDFDTGAPVPFTLDSADEANCLDEGAVIGASVDAKTTEPDELSTNLSKSWDLGLSDSMLASGLFAASPPPVPVTTSPVVTTTESTRRNSRKQSREERNEESVKAVEKDEEPTESMDTLNTVETTVSSTRPHKKRRESFLPQPSRRASMTLREPPIMENSTSVPTVTIDKKMISSSNVDRPSNPNNLGRGGNRRKSICPSSFSSSSSSSSTDTLPAPPAVRRSSRLSIAPIVDQENTQPSQVVSKRGCGSLVAPIAEELNSIPIKAHKMKPTASTALRPEEKAQVLRASNRRKSIAMGMGGNIKVELWKDM